MRIAFISLMAGLKWGGSESLWHAMAMHALEKGDEVFVSVYDFGPPVHDKIKMLQEKGATVYFRKRFNGNAGFKEKVVRFIKKRNPSANKDYQSVIDFKPDTIFISQGDSFDIAIHHLPLYKLIKNHHIPYSFVCHNHVQYSLIPGKEIYPGAVEVFQNAQFVYFVSHRQWKITERRIVSRISNGQFTWNPLNMAWPETPLPWPVDETVQMAIVANIDFNKGHDTMLEVLSEPQWKERKWILNLYGKGEGKEYLEDLAKYYGIEGRVVFHGHVNDIVAAWRSNQLLLIPSAGEGLPISLAEAMACGRAAVVTDVGGNTELVAAHETGFIAAAPTVSSFSGAMENAWSKKTDWQQYGINAFKKIHTLLEKDPHIKIYNQLTNGQ